MASAKTPGRDVRPIRLFYAFAAERAGTFEWNYRQQGREVWRVEIRKAA